MGLINSFYSQYFNGRVNSIVKKELSADTCAKEVKTGLGNFLGAKCASNQTLNEAIESNIDPLDVIVLDLIEALNISIVDDLSTVETGSIVTLKGKLMFRNYNVINGLLPIISEANIVPEFNQPFNADAKGKDRKFTVGKLMEKIVSIMPFGLEFEIISNEEHIAAIVKDEYLTIKPDDLIRTYGLTFPDEWTIIGIFDKAPLIQLNSDSQFKSGIDEITEYYYKTMNESSSGYTIRPIVVYRKISPV
ncbi:hypothetical protein ADU88_04215 [Clostridium botulinum]|nr:hypothetical protein ADU88_04215 [Clostridium botulinum]